MAEHDLVIVGGTGSLNGSVLAAALLILLPEGFKFLAIPEAIAPQLRQVLYGLLLVFFVINAPNGIIGWFKYFTSRKSTDLKEQPVPVKSS